MRIIANKDIDDDLLQKICKLEYEVFGDEYTVGEETFKNMHIDREGIFCIIDNGGNPIGFADALFISEEQKEQYLQDKDFRKLRNIGARIGDDNILYLFGLALKKEYRNTGIVRMFFQGFATWLDELGSRGVKMKYTFSEATSSDGARFSKAMGMIPVDASKLEPDGRGFYYSPDNLEKFCRRLRLG